MSKLVFKRLIAIMIIFCFIISFIPSQLINFAWAEETSETNQEVQIPTTTSLEKFEVTTEVIGGQGGTITEGSEVDKGSSFIYVITPDTGYRFTSVLIDDVEKVDDSFTDPTDLPFEQKIENVDKEHTIKVKFEKKIYCVEIEQSGNGEITDSDKQTFEDNKLNIEHGENLDIIVKSDTGYYISEFLVNDIPKEDAIGEKEFKYNIEGITEDTKIKVTFAENPHSIKITFGENGIIVNNDEENSVIVGGEIAILDGFDYTVKIIPALNYHVESIILNGDLVDLAAESENIVVEENGKNILYTFMEISQDHTLEVTFAIDTYKINFDVSGNGNLIHNENDVLLENIIEHGQEYSFTISPQDGYFISEFKIDEEDIAVDDSNIVFESSTHTFEYTFEEISSSHDVKIVFSPIAETDGSEDNYYKIVYEPAKLANNFTDENGTRIYILLHDAVATIEPIEPYSNIKINNDNNGFIPKRNITDTILIDQILITKDTEKISDSLKRVKMEDIKIIIDKTSPVINELTKAPEVEWTNQSVSVTAKVSDEGESGIHSVRYSNKPEDYEKDKYSSTGIPQASQSIDGYSFTIKNDSDKKEVYYVWTYDFSGNKSTVSEISVNIDITAPVVENVKKAPEDEWTKESVVVTGDVKDSGGSELNAVYYSTDENDYESEDGSSTVRKAEMSDGKFTFSIPNNESSYATYFIWSIDNAGNRSEKSNINVWIDVEKPEIITVTKSPSDEWSKDVVKITVTAKDSPKDHPSGIAGLRYSTTDDYENATEILSQNDIIEFETPKDENGIAIDFDGTYYIWVFDVAGNISDMKSIEVKIDTKAPTIKTFEYSPNYSLSSFIFFMKYGTFYNNTINVTVSANDGEISSGLSTISLLVGDKELATSKVDDKGVATFQISPLFSNIVTVVATDNLEHVSKPITPKEINKTILSDKLVLDDVAPVVNITPVGNKFVDKSKNEWYDDGSEFNIELSDPESGIKNIQVTINGKEVAVDKDNQPLNQNFPQMDMETISLLVSITQATINDDGSYEIKVTVTDNSGNISENLLKIFRDITKPTLSSIEFIESGTNKKVVSTMDQKLFTAFFSNTTNLVISANDLQPSSGISYLSYYYTEYNSDGSENTFQELKSLLGEDGKSIITLPESFKGYVFIKAVDNVGNESAYIRSSGVIVEPNKNHEQSSNIGLELPETEFYDGNRLPLYTKNSVLKVDISDYTAGISKAELKIYANNNTNILISETIEFASENPSSVTNQNWTIKQQTDNIVSKIEKSFLMDYDTNGIKVIVNLTDNVGNTSVQELSFSIDKTLPKVQVSFDNNEAVANISTNKKIFANSRTATISITDRNFDPSLVKFDLLTTYGITPYPKEWVETSAGDSGNKTYTTMLVFDSDGDYKFSFEVADRAEHKVNYKNNEDFVIDKTAPYISVNYGSAGYGKDFYNDSHQVEVQIRERNFDPSKIKISGTASDGDEKLQIPQLTNWKTEEDVHTASFNFAKDGSYSLSVDYSDLAGNKAEQCKILPFNIDTTKPELLIEGVGNKSANNGKVAPIIKYYDRNIDPEKVKITLTGANNGPMELLGSFVEMEKGTEYIFKDFDRKKSLDDIYTLDAELSDLAGNISKESIVFSVNRFGSVYVFDKKLKEIDNKYINKEVDVIFSETNVDTLKDDSINLKVSRNNEQLTLTKDKDYTISKNSQEGQWSQSIYHLRSGLFKEEGKYIVTIFSIDAAGNINENTDESKAAEITFGIDKTKPNIVPIDFKGDLVYNQNVKNAEISVNDNLLLGKVEIQLNNKPVTYSTNEDAYLFEVPGSDELQSVKIVAYDSAGNMAEKEIQNFYVTTDLFIRWYNNTPVFVGTTVFGGVGVLGVGSYIFFKRRFIFA